MTSRHDKILALCRGIRGDERGSPAVEFALIAPVLILLVFGIVQFGFAFFTYNEMLNGAREGARRLAVGATVEVAEARALSAMALDRNYRFVHPDPAPAANTAEVTMTVELSLSEAMVLSVLPLPDLITGRMITASVTMYKE